MEMKSVRDFQTNDIMDELSMHFSQQYSLFRSNSGFSLIEMAVVLVIFGLIIGTVTPLLVSQIKQEKVSKGREVVRQARDEVIGYALRNNCLPTPQIDSENGVQYLSPSNVAHVEDPWNQKIAYYPAKNTYGSNCFSCPQKPFEGNQIVQGVYEDDVTRIAFTLVSPSDDFTQQTSYNSTDDIMSANKTHDIVEFVSMDYLCSKILSMSSGNGGDGGSGDDDFPDTSNYESAGDDSIDWYQSSSGNTSVITNNPNEYPEKNIIFDRNPTKLTGQDKTLVAKNIMFEEPLEIQNNSIMTIKVEESVSFKNDIDIGQDSVIIIEALSNSNYPIYAYFKQDVFDTISVVDEDDYTIESVKDGVIKIEINYEIEITQ